MNKRIFIEKSTNKKILINISNKSTFNRKNKICEILSKLPFNELFFHRAHLNQTKRKPLKTQQPGQKNAKIVIEKIINQINIIILKLRARKMLYLPNDHSLCHKNAIKVPYSIKLMNI